MNSWSISSRFVLVGEFNWLQQPFVGSLEWRSWSQCHIQRYECVVRSVRIRLACGKMHIPGREEQRNGINFRFNDWKFKQIYLKKKYWINLPQCIVARSTAIRVFSTLFSCHRRECPSLHAYDMVLVPNEVSLVHEQRLDSWLPERSDHALVS